MTFFRKLFSTDNAAGSEPPTPPSDQSPSEEPEESPPQPATETPPSADDAWWASSPAEGEAPPANQSATAQHSNAAAPEEPESSTQEEETAPFSVLEIAQARDKIAAEQADDAAEPTEAVADTAAENEEGLEGTRFLPEDSAPSISAQRSQQGLAATALRDIGRVREVNQDSVFAMITTLPREENDLSVGLFVVADGMGGHDGGEIASRLAVRTVVHQVLSQLVLPAFDDTLDMALQPMMIAAVQAANEVIWEYARANNSDMGTTCTATLMIGQSLYIAHVGDSRAYLFEPGGLRLLTNDHSTVGRLIQMGQLEPSEAREHPLRNQLYRTVGQQPQIQVDFTYQQVGTASHVLLCSDGLWGMIDESHMMQALARSPWPQDACHELIALANLAGGDDNISAVVVSLPIAAR
ncbi:MAG: serine/threonine-protein phosphatase [Oscillochloris sp.]|nr:serine/threonine-protein phosphatase [Oscillochloris sp.]